MNIIFQVFPFFFSLAPWFPGIPFRANCELKASKGIVRSNFNPNQPSCRNKVKDEQGRQETWVRSPICKNNENL